MCTSDYAKNTITYHVHALSRVFGIDSTGDREMHAFVENLEQNIDTISTVQINTKSVVENLCDGNPHADNFLKLYNILKLRNIHELPSFLYLCMRIKQDPELFYALERISLSRATRPLNTPRSSNVALEPKGVDQLKQLIADSGFVTANTIPFFGYDHLRASVAASVDEAIPSDRRDSSRLHRTMASQHTRSRSARPGLFDSEMATSLAILDAGNPQKLPFQPKWLYERPTLWDDFLPPKRSEESSCVPIETLSNAVQEHAVVGDLLQCLQGNQGVYIKPLPLTSRDGVRSFSVDEKMTPTLLDTVNMILPICSDYSTVVRFVGQKSLFEHGFVNQALAGAMRRLIKDYMVLLCQLEYQYHNEQLGITRLQLFLRSTASIFTQLARVVSDIGRGNCTGGAVLSLLFDHARTVYGVKQTNDLLSYLLRAASVPFFKILQSWIYRGVISDPYGEFFIATGPVPDFMQPGHSQSRSPNHPDHIDHEYVDWAFFWERHYKVIRTNLPSFLDSHLKKILNTGKYLNVVQQCADVYELPAVEDLEYEEKDAKYLDQIERAHLFASNLLLKLLIEQQNLKEHLKSVKRYFLLDQADFIVHFMDAAAKELCKPSTDVSMQRLSFLLEHAIRTSTATVDPFKDNLKVVIFKYDLITQILMVLRAGSDLDPDPLAIEDMNLTGLEAFSVDYCANWPVSLILNRQVMDRYQMLFRHLFYCKHVERRLCNAWVLGKLARRADNLTATWFTTAFLLSQRMLIVIQHLQYYMSVEIIEPAWLQFFNQLNKLSNLDALMDAHLHCLEVCMDDCLLANPCLMNLFGKLTAVCVLFANFVEHVVASSTDGMGLFTSGSEDDAMSVAGRQRGDVARPMLHDPYLANSSGWSTDGRFARPGSKPSTAASSISGDTVLTKVTREDFERLGSTEAFAQKVIDFDRKFNGLIMEFLDQIRHYSKNRQKLSSLVSRLDFNDFYSVSPLTPTASGFGDLTGVYEDAAALPYAEFRRPSEVSSMGAEHMQPVSKPRSRRPAPTDSCAPHAARSTESGGPSDEDYI